MFARLRCSTVSAIERVNVIRRLSVLALPEIGIFFGLLIPATAYGAITARLILGKDMYSFLIGNNPFQWSYATLVHLVSWWNVRGVISLNIFPAIYFPGVPRHSDHPSKIFASNYVHFITHARIRFCGIAFPDINFLLPPKSDCRISVFALRCVLNIIVLPQSH